jgi:hypothetical protein
VFPHDAEMSRSAKQVSIICPDLSFASIDRCRQVNGITSSQWNVWGESSDKRRRPSQQCIGDRYQVPEIVLDVVPEDVD